MAWEIPLSDICMGDEEITAVTDVLQSGWLSMGPVTERFEDLFARYLGVRYAFAVSNGTAALHIAHRAAGIANGDEVIVPSLTFVATANAALYCGARPVFAEIAGKGDFNVSCEGIVEMITPRTRAITVVHYAGYPCDMGPILEVAGEHDLAVVEDAAHAVGSEYRGKKCGTLGDLGCFSFFSNKNLVTGEGGMIVTDDDALAERIRILRSHGMTALTWDRHRGHGHSYDVLDLGYNYRINEIASALGIVQLERLAESNRRRARIDRLYRTLLRNSDRVGCPFARHGGRSSCHIFPVLLSEDVSRSGVIESMKRKGIQTSVHYPPIHLFTYYRKAFGYGKGALPLTEYVGEHELTLPLYPGMSDRDVHRVVDCLNESLESERPAA